MRLWLEVEKLSPNAELHLIFNEKELTSTPVCSDIFNSDLLSPSQTRIQTNWAHTTFSKFPSDILMCVFGRLWGLVSHCA